MDVQTLLLSYIYGLSQDKNSTALPKDLLFLKLPFAVRPGLTDSSIRKSLGITDCWIICFNFLDFKLDNFLIN